MGSRGTAAPPPRLLANASTLRRRRDPPSRAGVAIERYSTPFDICKAFYKVRLETYAKRKAHLVKLKKGADPRPPTRRASILVPAGQVNVLRNKVRFILAVLSEELVVHNRKKARRGAPVIPSARRDSRNPRRPSV
jgi:hypothetical protein